MKPPVKRSNVYSFFFLSFQRDKMKKKNWKKKKSTHSHTQLVLHPHLYYTNQRTTLYFYIFAPSLLSPVKSWAWRESWVRLRLRRLTGTLVHRSRHPDYVRTYIYIPLLLILFLYVHSTSLSSTRQLAQPNPLSNILPSLYHRHTQTQLYDNNNNINLVKHHTPPCTNLLQYFSLSSFLNYTLLHCI